MRVLSAKDIEGIAEQVFALYKQLPEVKDKTVYRMEPELLLKKLLGLDVKYFHMSLDASVLGVTSYSYIELFFDNGLDNNHCALDGKTVLIEKDLLDNERAEGRKNFTIMHEGAHHILKIIFPNDYGVETVAPAVHYHRADKRNLKPITDWEEWQADALASALLMPKEIIYRGMHLVGLPEKIKVLSRICTGKDYKKFCMLADFLGVSKKALAIRLKQLGIVEKEYLDNPYGAIDIEMEV